MDSETRYIQDCYGLPSQFPRYIVTKAGVTYELRTASELDWFIRNGWELVSQ